MILISRERPTYQTGAYVQIEVNRQYRTMMCTEFRVTNGRHEIYYPEAECHECGELGGDTYDFAQDWQMNDTEWGDNKKFYIVLMEVREDGENHRSSSSGGVESSNPSSEESPVQQTLDSILGNLSQRGSGEG